MRFSPPSEVPTIVNLGTYLEDTVALVNGEEVCQTIELRRKSDSFADARLFFKDKIWITSAAGTRLIQILDTNPLIASTHQKKSVVSLRFDNELIASLGAQLESNDTTSLDGSDLLCGKVFAVGFVGPNTSKALHVGHLRNISVGNALAAALESAGAHVIRQSLVGDIGRNIGEAMAGYLQTGHRDDSDFKLMKSDHFVGKAYADYVRRHRATQIDTTAQNDPISRELEMTGDLADDLLRRWMGNDPNVLNLWRQLRNWIMMGHRDTLERLGVRLDRFDFESDAITGVGSLISDGLQRGLLKRTTDGRIIYESGHTEFETMTLVRKDGFPTEHARLLAVYSRLFDQWRSKCTYIDLAGTEWQPASALHMEIMRELRSSEIDQTHIQVFHGMVTVKDQKMNSSDGEAILIDHVLDQLVSAPSVRAIAENSNGAVTANTVADIVLKSYFLCRPVLKPIEYSWDLLMQEKSNPGWTIARTWCHVMSHENNTESDSAADKQAYRLAVIRSQDFRRCLRHGIETLQLSTLTSYLQHYCELFLEKPADAHLGRVARTLLQLTLTSLGLLTPIKSDLASM
ncbi:MAG: arginine--tRNA ligase [Acidobacteriota bacterium]